MINSYKETLIQGIKIVKKDSDSNKIILDGNKDIFVTDCLKYYIFNITNINDYFFSENETLDYLEKKIGCILYELKNSTNLVTDSIDILNDIMKKAKFISYNKKFFALTNINIVKEDLTDDFEILLKYFNLDYILKNEYSTNDKKYYQLIFSTEYTSYNPDLNIDNLRDIFYSFLGFCSYLFKNHSRTIMIRSADKLNIEYNIIDFNVYTILIGEDIEGYIEENGMNIQKPNECLDFNLKHLNEIIKQNDNFSFLFSNDKYHIFIKEIFKLYYEACIQKELKYSFLSFWSLSEYILKTIWNENLKDDELVEIIQEVFKKSFKNKYISFIISFIKEKRNKLVHENKNEINLLDQGIVKILTDILIYIFISNFEKIDSLQDYKNIIIPNK